MTERSDPKAENGAAPERQEAVRMGPCQRLVHVVGPVPTFRCRQIEDHPIHDPLTRGSHPYDPAPVTDEDRTRRIRLDDFAAIEANREEIIQRLLEQAQERYRGVLDGLKTYDEHFGRGE